MCSTDQIQTATFASEIKDVAEEVITPLPLSDVEESPRQYLARRHLRLCQRNLDLGNLQRHCLHLATHDRHWVEFIMKRLVGRLTMTVLDRSGLRIVFIDFIDNPYHGDHYADEGELCPMAPKDGTTTCHQHCTAYVISSGKPVTIAMTYVRNDKDEADADEH